MPKVYYRGGSDTHLVNGDDDAKRNILFARCADAALPYAEVTDAEMAALVADPSGDYAATPEPKALVARKFSDAPEVADIVADAPAPVARRGRTPKVEG